MARTIRLRRWQKAALERVAARTGPDVLAVATPGAGKTTFALAAARQHLADHARRRLVVVAPTQHLKGQWADAAEALELHLAPWPRWPGTRSSCWTRSTTRARSGRGATPRGPPIADAAARLSLSGTPFRADTRAIPFVRDDDDTACPDIEYGYADALSDDGVVRPVRFPRTDGEMKWVAGDGTPASATFGDRLDAVAAGQRRAHALAIAALARQIARITGLSHSR